MLFLYYCPNIEQRDWNPVESAIWGPCIINIQRFKTRPFLDASLPGVSNDGIVDFKLAGSEGESDTHTYRQCNKVGYRGRCRTLSEPIFEQRATP